MRLNYIVPLLLVFLLVFTAAGTAQARDITVEVNGELQDYDQPPAMINNKVMVPVRGVFSSLGAELTWLKAEKTVKAVKNDVEIYLRPGDDVARKNSEKIILQEPPVIINGRTMVPVRFVGESFGARVEWNGIDSRVVVELEEPRTIEEIMETPIVSKTALSVDRAREWAKNRGATDHFIDLAQLYWELAPQRGGVNPAGAYVQAAKETGFGRFGGVVSPEFKNPCGLKTSEGGGNYDPDAHQRFNSWEEGVKAHLDHLALYAGAPGYPKANTPDPRHFPVLKGRAETFKDLGGNWAPSPEYGVSLIEDYLAPLVNKEYE